MKKINKQLLENVTLIYVEDEEIIREEVEFFLSQFIKNIYMATNGEEGLALYKEVNPDIIITDIQMPKMNGLEMIKKINNKNIPIIVTTAFSDIEFLLEAIELKVSKFIIKPMDLSEILFNIQNLIVNTRLKDKLFEKDKLLEIIDENVLISVTNKKGVIIDASHAFCKFVGYTKDELIGNTHKILRHKDTSDTFYEKLWETIKKGKIFTSEIKNRKKSGELYWAILTITPVFKDEQIVNFTAIREEITHRKMLEQLAIYDDLTGIYNRRYFNKIIENEIRRIKREDSILSIAFIDIDYFKKYNDSYGHPKGDEVLKKVAKILKENCLRASDHIFRVGGEEFILLFSGLSIEESIEFIKEIIKAVKNLKIEHKSSTCNDYITISVGLLVQSAKYLQDAEYLYRYSDNALYKAKNSGRNQLVISEQSK